MLTCNRAKEPLAATRSAPVARSCASCHHGRPSYRLPPVGTCGEGGVTPWDTLMASLAALCMTENHKRGRAAAARPACRALACSAAEAHQQPRLHRRGAARGAKAPHRGGRRWPESAGRAQERTRSRPRRTERQTVSPKGWDGREAGLRAILARVPQGRWPTDEGERDESPEGEEVAQPGVRRLQPRRLYHLVSIKIVLVLDRVRMTFGS